MRSTPIRCINCGKALRGKGKAYAMLGGPEIQYCTADDCVRAMVKASPDNPFVELLKQLGLD